MAAAGSTRRTQTQMAEGQLPKLSAEDALANQQGEIDFGRASAQLAEATAQLAALRKLKNRAGRG